MRVIHALACLAMTSSFGSMAWAQTVPAPAPISAAPTDVAAEQADASAADPVAQDIVVTGSRLARDGSRAPTPVTAVLADTLQTTAPSNIPDALNKLPQFSNSSNQYSSPTFSPTVAPQGNFLNLRSLGAQRMLVLLDGSRVSPTSNSNAVDTNMLPQLLVQRVDIVTGGASAVYGSDAVSGVVNFILDQKFKGLKAVAQTGISDKGDGFSYRVGIAGGASYFDDRAHLLFSYERYDSKGLSLDSRDWAYGDFPVAVGTGTAANPYSTVVNSRLNDLTDGGLIRSGALAGRYFRPDGSLANYVPGTRTGTSNIEIGGDGATYPAEALVARLKTDQAFTRASVEVTPAISMFAQGSFARSESGFSSIHATHRIGSNRAITIFADNPYLRADYAATLTGAGQTGFGLARLFNDVAANEQRSVTTFFNGQYGLRGDLGGSWKAEANYVHGRAQLDLSQREFDNRRFYAAIDAVRDPATGGIVCGVTFRNPGALPGCVPLNVLGAGNVDAAAIDYIRGRSSYRVINTLDYVNANVHGDLFALPAGPLSIAIGGELRWQKLVQTTTSDPATLGGPTSAARAAYFAGIRGVPSNALLSAVTNVGPAAGSQQVKEIYGEALVPILRDTAFFRNLELSLAGRYTDYRTSGGVTSWKAGLSWTPVDGIRFRGTQSRDIAAPGLYDLYAGPNVVTVAVTDPLTGLTLPTLRVTAGNTALRPEKADTTVVGMVIQPAFVPRLTISIDAYRIKINDAIQTTDENQQLSACQASGGTAEVCTLISRPFPFTNTSAANFPTQILVAPQNLASILTKGVDVELSYAVPLDDVLPAIGGTLGFRAFANYLDSYATQGAAGQPVIERAGSVFTSALANGLPRWKGLLTQSYTNGGFSLALNERFTGRYRRVTTEAIVPAAAIAPNRTYVDLNLSYAVGPARRFEIFGNVQNLFDVEPPILPTLGAAGIGAPTDKAAYNVLGRYITTGVRMRF